MRDEQQANLTQETPAATSGAYPSSAVPSAVTCPFCQSRDTEILAIFGSQLSTRQYYCRSCHTPFEYMKQEAQER